MRSQPAPPLREAKADGEASEENAARLFSSLVQTDKVVLSVL